MAPRSIWKGNLGFGLVSIPVRLHRAVAKKRLRFHEIHAADGGRIRRRAVCSVDGATVPREHIVKGIEIERGHLVTVSADELHAFDPRAARGVEIKEFIDAKEIDPILFERSYYLAPDAGAARAYAILVAAMTSRRRAAIARITMRAQQHLCVIRPTRERVLLLSILGYADEILPAAPFAAALDPDEQPSERELALAERLVDALTGRFRPERYHDDQRERLLTFLHAKAEGATPASLPEAAQRAEPADLPGALEASVAEAERHKTAA